MNKFEKKFNSNDYQPKRFGLKYSPPQIILEYMVPSTGKLYHHKMRLNKISKESKIEEIMREIYEKHSPYLDNKKVLPNQMIKLIDKLKNNLKNSSIVEDEKNLNNIKKSNVDRDIIFNENYRKFQDDKNNIEQEIDYYKYYDFENEDLNRLNDLELKKRKNEMDYLYNKNAILPGQDGFVFDVRKDFDIERYDPEWDEEDDESDDKF